MIGFMSTSLNVDRRAFSLCAIKSLSAVFLRSRVMGTRSSIRDWSLETGLTSTVGVTEVTSFSGACLLVSR